MSDTESFDHVMAEMRKIVMNCDMERCDMYDGDCYKCQGDILDRLQRAHERELEHVRKAEYARGYHDGQRSMDAEHYAVALRLMHLPLDGGSHENLSQIARAVWHNDFGWTQGACKELRDELVRLMGGVHEPSSFAKSGDFGKLGDDGHCEIDKDCQIHQTTTLYDALGNERHKAVCELKKIHADAGGFVKALANALGVEWQAPRVVQTIAEVRDRLIYLLGGDEPTAMEYIQHIVREHDRKCLDMELSGAELSQASADAMSRRADQPHEPSPMRLENETGITDELREWMDLVLTADDQAWDIADRIDEQEHKLRKQSNEFKRAMCAAQDLLEKRIEERDELQRKLDSMAQEYIAMRSALEISSSAMKEVVVERDELQEKLDAIREAVDAAQ